MATTLKTVMETFELLPVSILLSYGSYSSQLYCSCTEKRAKYITVALHFFSVFGLYVSFLFICQLYNSLIFIPAIVFLFYVIFHLFSSQRGLISFSHLRVPWSLYFLLTSTHICSFLHDFLCWPYDFWLSEHIFLHLIVLLEHLIASHPCRLYFPDI